MDPITENASEAPQDSIGNGVSKVDAGDIEDGDTTAYVADAVTSTPEFVEKVDEPVEQASSPFSRKKVASLVRGNWKVVLGVGIFLIVFLVVVPTSVVTSRKEDDVSKDLIIGPPDHEAEEPAEMDQPTDGETASGVDPPIQPTEGDSETISNTDPAPEDTSPTAPDGETSPEAPSAGEDTSPTAPDSETSPEAPSAGEDTIPTAPDGETSPAAPNSGEDTSPTAPDGETSPAAPNAGEDKSPAAPDGGETSPATPGEIDDGEASSSVIYSPPEDKNPADPNDGMVTSQAEDQPGWPDAEEYEAPEPENPPPNDLCADAISLKWPAFTMSSMQVSGTTVDSMFEDLGYSRFDVDQKFGFDKIYLDETGTVCDWRFSTGVWYKISGRGRGIRASTCDGSEDGDSKANLSVYEGSDCASLSCVVNHSTGCGSNSFLKRNCLSWYGEQGKTYYIFVETATEGQGPFSMELEEFSTARNDVCSGAITMEVDKPVSASVSGATAEFVGKTTNDEIGDVLPGVFYDVVGTGNTMKVASECDETGSSRIYVYERPCGRKRLVGERAICEPNSVAYFESVKDQVYHILFQSDSAAQKTLVVTEEKPALNDMCLGAVGPIELYTSISGNTDDARESLDYWVDSMYYTVIGTGEKMQVKTPCTEETMGRGARLDVFAGSCSVRTDVSDKISRHACGNDSIWTENSVTWQSQAGEEYYVQVLSNIGTGPYTFSVEDVGADVTPSPTPSSTAADDTPAPTAAGTN